MKKQSFLQGAGILAIATIVVKVIGAFYKIPLYNIIGADGNAYFFQTYNIYSFLLTVSTAGLPVAISRMIAKSLAEGNPAQARRVDEVSFKVMFGIGLAGALIMMVFCKPLAIAVGLPKSAPTILALGPAVLFVCINSAYRGFFQGQSMMTPTGVSQVIEAVCKLFLGLLLAFVIKRITLAATAPNEVFDVVPTVAGAILGVTIGSLLAFFYLFILYRRNRCQLDDGGATQPSKTRGATVRELLSIAIPITIGSAGLQGIILIDNSLVMLRMTGAAKLAEEAATAYMGLYGAAQTLFALPSSLVAPFTISVIPAITACVTKRNHLGAMRVENSAIRIMTLLILPCGVGLCVLAEPIIRLLYRANTAEQNAVAGALLAILSVAVIFNGLVLLLNAIMQAHGFVILPVINMMVGGVVKLIINFILVGNPSIHIYGAPTGTVIGFIVMTLLDVFCIRRIIPHPPKMLRLMGKPILACAVMGAVAWAVNALLAPISATIACIAAIGVAVVVYVILVLVLKIITYEDCMLLPKGKKIAAFLKISG